MASRRMIHTKIWDSDQFNKLTIPERILYINTITIADDEGCFRADGKFLRKSAFYYDKIGIPGVEKMLKRLADVGLIVLGNSQNGIAGFHPKWKKYQQLRADRCKPSDYSDLLVANGVTPRFQDAAEEKVEQLSSGQEIILGHSHTDSVSSISHHAELMRKAMNERKGKIGTIK